MRYGLKLGITIILLATISFGIGGTLMISTSFRTSLDTETQAALEDFEAVQNTLFLLNELGANADYETLINALGRMADQDIQSWQAMALYVGDEIIFRDGNAQVLETTLTPPQSDQCAYMPVSDSYGHGLLVCGSIDSDELELTLLARFDLSDVYAARQTQLRIYGIIFAAVALLGLVGSLILSATLTRHLRVLTAAARKIAGGDLSQRTGIESEDEFGQLSRDFDAMADSLQENFARLETEMERQEQFMGAFAHELKTPMTSIIGFADLLRQGDLDENTRMRAADFIYSEGHRLERLSFKLLELLLLKKDGLQRKQVWVPRFLQEIERALSPTLSGKGIKLICRSQQLRVAFEPDLVKSVLYNLVDNASKAMDGEGIIGVSATQIPGGCQFQVIDNGRGMEQAELKRITEAFYRVDKARSRSQGGAGLGLALCKQIVQLHSGSIRFASVPGKGTRVTVTLYEEAVKQDA